MSPIVLRKNLFRLGFSHTQFQEHEGKINKLLSYRNSIAHGEMRTGVAVDVYEDLKKMVFLIMDAVGQLVVESLRDKQFL